MGIFNNKQDVTTTITPDGSSSSDATDNVKVDTPINVGSDSTTTGTSDASTDQTTAPVIDSVSEEVPATEDTTTKETSLEESASEESATSTPSTEPEVSTEAINDILKTPETATTPPLDLPSIENSEPTTPTSIKVEEPSNNIVSSSTSTESDLSEIKDQAIKQLSPLVGLLDQAPEEKFHTTMMMLQSTDDKSLIKSAYEVAQQITDEKARAQALLDVVNEINYFTQQSENKN